MSQLESREIMVDRSGAYNVVRDVKWLAQKYELKKHALKFRSQFKTSNFDVKELTVKNTTTEQKHFQAETFTQLFFFFFLFNKLRLFDFSAAFDTR